ncbi:MAG: CBS domain-containing protein [Gemmataceae bacterium]
MICPHCGHDNLPGSETCDRCLQDLTQLDQPVAQDRVERSLMEDEVASLNPARPVTAPPNATIRQALDTMLGMGVGSLLIINENQELVGILSERDLLLKVAGIHEPYMDLPVSQFMTPQPETIAADDTLAFGLHKMDVGGYRHLPVMKDGRPEGVISVRDMIRHITQLCKLS